MKFNRQPLIWLNLISLAIGLATTFGFSLTAEQTAAVMAFLQAVATAVGWTQVTPVNDPDPAVVARAARPPHVPDAGHEPIKPPPH